MTRNEMIAHLVMAAEQLGIRTTEGKPYTAEIFEGADDAWLKEQMRKLNARGVTRNKGLLH